MAFDPTFTLRFPVSKNWRFVIAVGPHYSLVQLRLHLIENLLRVGAIVATAPLLLFALGLLPGAFRNSLWLCWLPTWRLQPHRPLNWLYLFGTTRPSRPCLQKFTVWVPLPRFQFPGVLFFGFRFAIPDLLLPGFAALGIILVAPGTLIVSKPSSPAQSAASLITRSHRTLPSSRSRTITSAAEPIKTSHRAPRSRSTTSRTPRIP